MPRSIRALATCAALLCFTPTHGDAAPTKEKTESKPKPPTSSRAALPITRAPAKLAPSKLLPRINSALKRIGKPPLAEAPQELAMRITPMGPRLDNGARVVEADNVNVIGPIAEVPDGAYMLNPASSFYASVMVEFPTTAGKIHVADCRAREYYFGGDQDAQLSVSGTDIPDAVMTGIDGHLVLAFVATGTTAMLRLTWPEDTALHGVAFFGCDFGPTG